MSLCVDEKDNSSHMAAVVKKSDTANWTDSLKVSRSIPSRGALQNLYSIMLTNGSPDRQTGCHTLTEAGSLTSAEGGSDRFFAILDDKGH